MYTIHFLPYFIINILFITIHYSLFTIYFSRPYCFNLR